MYTNLLLSNILWVLLLLVYIYKEEIEIVCKIIYNQIALALESIVEYERVNCLLAMGLTKLEIQQLQYPSPWDTEWDKLLEGVTCSVSISKYQEGCSYDTLVPEDDVMCWQDEMRRDLSMYCPDIFIEFVIRRFEEIKDETN